MRRVWIGSRHAAIALGALALFTSLVAARDSTRSYGGTIGKLPRLTTTEADLLEAVQAWAASHNQTLVLDARLRLAAAELTGEVPGAREQAMNLEQARHATQRWGSVDGQLALIGVRLPTGEAVAPILQRELEGDLVNRRFDHVGIAARERGGAVSAVILLSRRLVELRPVAKRVAPGARIRLSGTLLPATAPAAQMTLAIGLPDGSVERQALGRVQERFTTTLHAPTTPGIVQVQLLIDRGTGPEIAALFPIGVDVDPFAGEPAPGTGVAGPPLTDPVAVEAQLVELLLETRRQERLTLPAPADEIVAAARAHATDMRDGDFFAHVSPSHGDVVKRLQQRKIPYRRALENIATGRSAAEIFRGWMTSPAHRANLLDPSVNRFGIGVSLRPATTGVRAYAVSIFVEQVAPHIRSSQASGSMP